MNEYQKQQITRFMHMQIVELNILMSTLGCPIKVTYNITDTENLDEWTKHFAVPFEMPSKKDQNASEDLTGEPYQKAWTSLKVQTVEDFVEWIKSLPFAQGEPDCKSPSDDQTKQP